MTASAFTYDFEEALDAIEEELSVGLVPMLHGSPGIGKSALAYFIAKIFNLVLIDIRLSQADPTDLNGFPAVVDGVATYIPFAMFPTENTPVPKGKDGWLIFFDEINAAPKAVQAAAYKPILDHEVGNHKLHSKVVKMAAGNLETDNAIVERMSSALQSRMAHLELRASPEGWLGYAQTQGFDYRITSFINYEKDKLMAFDPNHSDRTYACPRTWEFANRLVSRWKDMEFRETKMLAGILSQGVALEFVNFTKVYKDLPTIDEIINNPNSSKLPSEPSTQYAVSGLIANHATKANIKSLLDYVDRLPKEFQIVCVREMSKRYPGAKQEPKFIKKITEVATHL